MKGFDLLLFKPEQLHDGFHVAGRGPRIDTASGRNIAQLQPRDKQYAMLFAASVEMLDALQEAVNWNEEYKQLNRRRRRSLLGANGKRCAQKIGAEREGPLMTCHNCEQEKDKLLNAYFQDQTIAPDGKLRPTFSRLVERADKAEAELSTTHCPNRRSAATCGCNRSGRDG